MPGLNDFDNEFATPAQVDATSTETQAVTSSAEELVPREAIVEDAPQSFRREIDLGDGSGKQVFEADTLEALVDKLAEAQTHATKKIREQAAQIRKKPERAEERVVEPAGVSGKRALTADEKFALAQKFQSDPDSAFDELYEAKFGRKPDEDAQDREFIRQVRYEREIGAIDNAFLASNPEFHQSQSNAAAMVNFLKSENLPYTKANLEYAFQELTDSGLLEVKPDAASESKAGDSERISQEAKPRSKQMSTGVRTASVTSRRAPEAKQELESDVQKILAEPDLDKARQLMLKRMAAAKSSR